MIEEDESKSAPTKKTLGEYKKYHDQVKRAEAEQREYIQRANKVVDRYRDEDRKSNSGTARYNVLWSNTETTGPVLYNRVPKVQVDRRFKDNDPISRCACEIWERSTQFSLEDYDFDSVMKSTIKDFQLAGRGTAWVRYEPYTENDAIKFQRVLSDHVHFSDFLHTPAKQWSNVRAVGRKIYLNRKQLIDRFGKIGRKIPLDYNGRDIEDQSRRSNSEKKENKQACIYEWWDSDTMEVVWLSKNYVDGILDKLEDPLGLQGFFPTPKPLFGITTTDTLIPVPEFCQYQDQARELDSICIKISLLLDAIGLKGAHDASFHQLKQIVETTKQNILIPLPNWQAFQAQGGFEGVMQFMPLADFVGALKVLYDARDKTKASIDEISGVADILRGATSPIGTTATEQQIKGQFAANRLADKQRDVQRYAKDLIALQGEIIAEHFEPPVLAMMSGYDTAPIEMQQRFMEAVTLLKSDPMRSFKIDIETDSMVAVDEALDKQKTTEFLDVVGKFMGSAVTAVQQAPVLAPVMSEMLMYAVRRFRAGRSLENTIEQAGQGLIQMAQAAMNAPPTQDPAMIKAQAEIELEKTKSQNDFTLKQAEISQKAEALARENTQKMAANELEANNRMELEKLKADQQMILSREKAANELVLAREKMEYEMQLEYEKHTMKTDMERHGMAIKAAADGMHVSKDGKVSKSPPMVKKGRFYTDPATGERNVEIIEQPLEQ